MPDIRTRIRIKKDVQVSITGDLLNLKGQRMEVEAVKPKGIKIDERPLTGEQ